MDGERKLGKPVFYGSAHLYKFDRWMPEDIRVVLEKYDSLIREKKYDEVLAMERNEGAPVTWLNWVLSTNRLSREQIGNGNLQGARAAFGDERKGLKIALF